MRIEISLAAQTLELLGEGGETILRKKDRGIWKATTWSELDAHVRAIGQGLLAYLPMVAVGSQLGLGGDRPVVLVSFGPSALQRRRRPEPTWMSIRPRGLEVSTIGSTIYANPSR